MAAAEAAAPVPALPPLPLTARTGRSSGSALTARPLAARLATKVALYRERSGLLPARGGGGGGTGGGGAVTGSVEADALPEGPRTGNLSAPTARGTKAEATAKWLAEVMRLRTYACVRVWGGGGQRGRSHETCHRSVLVDWTLPRGAPRTVRRAAS